MTAYRILVTGSRELSPASEGIVIDALRMAHGDAFQLDRHGEIVLVHGAAAGIDRLAAEIAERAGWALEAHRADWEGRGKIAGPERNARMVAAGADICLAFPRSGSRGTWDCIRRAADAGIPVRIYPLTRKGLS